MKKSEAVTKSEWERETILHIIITLSQSSLMLFVASKPVAHFKNWSKAQFLLYTYGCNSSDKNRTISIASEVQKIVNLLQRQLSWLVIQSCPPHAIPLSLMLSPLSQMHSEFMAIKNDIFEYLFDFFYYLISPWTLHFTYECICNCSVWLQIFLWNLLTPPLDKSRLELSTIVPPLVCTSIESEIYWSRYCLNFIGIVCVSSSPPPHILSRSLFV